MDPGAIINVNGATFNLWNNANGLSFIFACTTMWQAINVNNGGSISFRGSSIRGGKQGIVINPGFNNGASEITNCSFTGNSSAITATNVPNFTFSAFSGNNFTGRNLGPLLPPHGALEPFFAINLQNCTGTIGTAGTVNIFNRHSTAIKANGGTYTINNCSFIGNTFLDWEGFGTGIGIWVINANLTIDNIFSNGVSCSFDENRRAVRFDNSGNLVLRNAVFSNSRVVDVEVVGSAQPYNINISNNRFNIRNPSQQSIFIDRAAQLLGVHTRVQSNFFNLPATPGFPLNNNFRFIDVVSRPGTTDQAIIANNPITCTYGNGPAGTIARTTDGIWIQGNADGYQVSGNTLNFVNANGGVAPNADIVTVGLGMTLNNGINNIIGPNNVISTTRFGGANEYRQSWLRCGVHVDRSMNVLVCKNDSDDPRHAYHFQGNCNNGEFGRNKVRDAIIGLEMSGATFPNQDYRMNEWDPVATYNLNSVRAPYVGGAPWRADGTIPGHVPTAILQPMDPNNFIFSIPNGQTSGTPICDGVLPPVGGFGEPPTGENAKDFVEEKFSFDNYAASWDFEKNLLNLMIRFPNSFVGEPIAVNYYNSKVNTSIWNFAKAERLLHDAVVLTGSQQQSLDLLNASIVQLSDSLGKIELLEGADTLTTTAALQTAKTNVLAELHSKNAELTSLYSEIANQRIGGYANAISFIESLPASNELESNQKTVLKLHCAYLKGDAWSNSDTTALRNIAYSCPETGGEAVWAARGLLPAPERYTFPREVEENCGAQYHSEKEQQAFLLSGTMVFPNPAQDLITVGFSEKFSGKVELRNINGHLIYSRNCRGVISESFDTAHLPAGLYLVNLKAENGLQQSFKCQVIH